MNAHPLYDHTGGHEDPTPQVLVSGPTRRRVLLSGNHLCGPTADYFAPYFSAPYLATQPRRSQYLPSPKVAPAPASASAIRIIA